MLFLYMVLSFCAVVFWIIGILFGILLANFTGMDSRNMGIIFGGIGVILGVMIGNRAINRAIYGI